MYLDVPASEDFTLEMLTDNNDLWFSIADEYRYSRISGAGLETVSVDQTGKMELAGVQTDFSLAYGAPAANKPLLTLEGKGFGNITAEIKGDLIHAGGALDKYQVEVIDSEGNTQYNETIIVSPSDGITGDPVEDVLPEK